MSAPAGYVHPKTIRDLTDGLEIWVPEPRPVDSKIAGQLIPMAGLVFERELDDVELVRCRVKATTVSDEQARLPGVD